MERPDDESEVYDGWGNHPGRFRMQVGNASNDGRKLVWWLLGLFGLGIVAEVGWLGNAVVDLKSEVASLRVEVNFLITERKNARP